MFKRSVKYLNGELIVYRKLTPYLFIIYKIYIFDYLYGSIGIIIAFYDINYIYSGTFYSFKYFK